MARHGRQEQANEWGVPVMNRGKALVRDIREIVATHDLADMEIRRKVELLAEVAWPNGLERATMQMEVGKIRARQCEIARRCTDRMFGGGYAGQEGAMATALGRILNRYRVEIDMVNLAIDTAGAREWERDWKWEQGFSPSVCANAQQAPFKQSRKAANLKVCRSAFSRLPTAQSEIEARHRCLQPATSPRSNPEDCRGAAESRQSRDFGAFIRGSQGDDEGFSPSVSGGAADSSPIRWSQGDDEGFSPSVRCADSSLIRGSQGAERAVCEADLSAQAQRSYAEHNARETRCQAHGEGSGAERAVCEADLSAQAQRSIATHDARETRVQTNGAERGAMAI